MSSAAPFGLPRWETRADALHASCRVFEIRRRTCRHPVRGTERDFFVLRAPDWVNVLALTPDGHLVLVTQYRFGSEGFSLEIPGGMIEQGEDPVAAGLRELAEETGYVGARARLLASVHPNPAIQGNRCHLVLVEEAVPAQATEWDADEEIALTTLPADEVLAAAQDGRITHALVLNALFFFRPWWEARRSGARPPAGR